MNKLNDTQLVLLSHAGRQDNGSLLPVPAMITASRAAISKAIGAMIKRGLAEEGEVSDANLTWRQEGDTCLGVRITPAGRQAVGIEVGASGAVIDAPIDPKLVKRTKASLVLELVQREQGATLADLIDATGWLPHTTRAALTGLRKKGHPIEKARRGEITCYHLAA